MLFCDGSDGKREYLVLHYEEGHWDLPKGHVEQGETEEETALRELREETGIQDAELKNGFRGKISYSYTRNGQKYFKDVYFYLAESPNKTITLSDEHTDFQWLSFEKAYKIVTHKNSKELLRKAEEFLGSK